MSVFDEGIDSTLRREGGFFHNEVTGEIVNHGITASFLKAHGMEADEAYIQSMPVSLAKALYFKYIWLPNHYGGINDQRLASRVFDICVNCGPGGSESVGANNMLQWAANDCGAKLSADAKIGPLTLAAVNALDPSKVYDAFIVRCAKHYELVALANDKLRGNLQGWLARLHD